MILSLSVILCGFLATLGFTALVRRHLVRQAVLDIPNERSSHTVPVPRGGGWALVLVLLPALTAFLYLTPLDHRPIGLMIALFLLVGVSWLDDRRDVSARLRLSIHLLAAALGSTSFTAEETLFGGFLPLWLDRGVMIVGWAWFINLYNFMDGIDGITGVETISIATGLCLLLSIAGIDAPFVHFLTLALTGVCLGFLAHNWHPARLFLGDVGSVPLGYLVGFALLSVAVKGYGVAALVLPLYYLADSGLTLGKRALRGEKIWQAHRSHFYQRAAAGLKRHDRVVFMIIAANILLIAAAALAVSFPLAGFISGIVIVAILLITMHKCALQD